MLIEHDPKADIFVLVDNNNESYNIRMGLRRIGGKYTKRAGFWMFAATLEVLRDLKALGLEEGASIEQWRFHENMRLKTLRSGRNGGLKRRDVYYGWREKVFGLGSRLKPYNHQVIGSEFLSVSRGAMLLDEMGLGKTRQAIDAACYHLMNTNIKRVIIVCPNSVKINWFREVSKFGWPGIKNSVVPSGNTVDRKTYIRVLIQQYGVSWTILNYEALRYFPDEFRALCEDQIVILDEAHRAKNHKAKVTKILMGIKPKHIWLLTGTPVANRPEDLWSLINLVRPGMAGWSFWEFSKRHIVRAKNNMIVGYKDTDRLEQMMERIALQRKKELCVDLPEKIFSALHVELSDQEMKAYEMMRKTLRAWMESEIDEEPTTTQAMTFASRFIRLRQLADGFVSEGADGNLQWAKVPTKITSVLESYQDSGKQHCVVWCQFLAVGNKLVLEARKKKIPCDFICGNVPVYEREKIIQDWENKGGVLVGQMDTLGEGVNLHKASLQYYIDIPFTPRQRLQTTDRLHRIGQTEDVLIVDVLAKNTVDYRILQNLDKKIMLAEEITRMTRTEMMDLVGE